MRAQVPKPRVWACRQTPQNLLDFAFTQDKIKPKQKDFAIAWRKSSFVQPRTEHSRVVVNNTICFMKLNKIKRKLIQTPLAKLLKEIEAKFHQIKVLFNKSNSIKNNKTLYCISPYKTGTTFLAACYDQSISQHEPMQYCTLKNIDNNFDTFFIKRLNALDLKLECSGFLSAYINNLAINKITKDLSYVCILRKPTDWINSVLNYWPNLKYLKFDYINTYFWKNKVGVDLLDFHNKSQKEKEEIIDKLIVFYFNFLEETKKLINIDYYELSELEKNLIKIDKQIKEKSIINKSKTNKNKEKHFNYKNADLDLKYLEVIKNLKSK